MQDKIIESYESGNGVVFIAKEFGVHRSTVQRILKRAGKKLRKATPTFKYDFTFFSKYTEESAYWAGFIAADGHIRSGDRKTLSIKLSSIDYEHLVKFKEAIEFSGNVHKSERGYSYIDISGEWITDTLNENFNISERKTHNLQFPTLPPDLLPHFVRGFFDGDGSITSAAMPVVTFTCASSQFMQTIQQIMRDDVGVVLKSKNDVPPIQNGVQISYSGKNAEKIIRWMYADSEPHTRLDRKFIKAYDVLMLNKENNNE